MEALPRGWIGERAGQGGVRGRRNRRGNTVPAGRLWNEKSAMRSRPERDPRPSLYEMRNDDNEMRRPYNNSGTPPPDRTSARLTLGEPGGGVVEVALLELRRLDEVLLVVVVDVRVDVGVVGGGEGRVGWEGRGERLVQAVPEGPVRRHRLVDLGAAPAE